VVGADAVSERAASRDIVAGWRAASSGSNAPHVRARATVTTAPDGGFALRLDITADDVVTSHAVEARECSALADATALQIAMALGLVGDAGEDAPEPIVPTPTEIPPPPPAAATSAPVTAPTDDRAAPAIAPIDPAPRRRSIPLRGAVRVQGGAGTGRVPRVDARLAIGAALRFRRARIEAIAAHTFVQQQPHPDRDGLSLRVWQWSGQLRGCWVPRVGPLELPVCGGLEAGAARATSRGVPIRRTATIPFVAGVFGAALAWPFARRFALWVEGMGWVSATRPAFTVDGLPPWFTARRGGFDGAVGLEVRFP
jgi:hypothetical protein